MRRCSAKGQRSKACPCCTVHMPTIVRAVIYFWSSDPAGASGIISRCCPPVSMGETGGCAPVAFFICAKKLSGLTTCTRRSFSTFLRASPASLPPSLATFLFSSKPMASSAMAIFLVTSSPSIGQLIADVNGF